MTPVFGWVFMFIFWAAVIIAVLALFRYGIGKSGPGCTQSPEDILKKRYVSGEISEEEFKRMSNNISS